MGRMSEGLKWAQEEFGQAELGNRLRTRRLVAMGARLVDGPAGLVTSVFRKGRERVGAYRFVENEKVRPDAIVASCAQAAIRRAKGEEWIWVPIDGSSLTLADPSHRRRLGTVGPHGKNGRGLKTMTAMAVHEDGTPLGLLDLQWWARQLVPGGKHTRTQRTVEQKETRFWLQAISRVEAALARAEATVRAWYVVDREGDFHDLLHQMAGLNRSRLTVRACQNRRTATGECAKLWETLQHTQAVGGRYSLDVPAGPNRKARCACMAVRWARVELLLPPPGARSTSRRQPVAVWAVLALEESPVPTGEKPLQWLLLTNAQVSNFHAAAEVLYGYSQRWRVEDFHRAWKTQCAVEETQLHDQAHVRVWATLLAAVAMRIERLKHLARTQPDTPADVELNREEIDAVIVLRQPPGFKRGDTPGIGQVVRWIADLGGYVGPSNGPPGATVIGRGLKDVETAAQVLRHLDDH